MNSNSNIKPISKFIAFVTAFTSIAASSGLTAFAAEEAEPTFTEGTLTALVNSVDNVASIDCRYYSNMPNVPYMKLSEYYSLWTGQELAIANNNDGTYEVKVPAGVKGTYDVENDTVSTDDESYFFKPEDELNAENPYANLFIRSPEVDSEYVATAVELDFSNYNIDLIGDEDELWLPIATLCDVYTSDLRIPFFMEDTLIFGNELLSEFSISSLAYSEAHANGLINQYANGRPADLAEFNYNELCFAFDLNYGFPGRPYFTDLIKEKGLDGMLTEGNDTTRAIKELLLSTDFASYVCGFDLLNMYLWDGGHTMFPSLPSMISEEYFLRSQEIIMSLGVDFANASDLNGDQMSKMLSQEAITAAREEMVPTADSFEILNSGSIYIVKDDTAIFSFDEFATDLSTWLSYYNGESEMPQDLIADFYNCVLAADENPEITNFVIDLGTNGGGLILTANYMLGLIADVDFYNCNLNNVPSTQQYLVDKNFDNVIDEKDEEFTTDLNFGVITSCNSYSCGNLFPSIARENGIMLMGETSGGGACAVNYHLTADGMLFTLSSGICLTDKDFNSIDLGITPDYETFKVNADGTKDFSDTYNFDTIKNCFNDFYGTETVTTTTTTATETTTTTTTTTTAVETETTTEDTTTTETTTEAATTTETTTTAPETTTAATTTTPETTTQPTENVTSDDNLCFWAIADYYDKTGVTADNAEITAKGDVYEITLTDSEGKVLSVYSIDPATGVGTSSTGEEVNLPQTGTLSLNNLFMVLGAFALTVCGFFAVMASGMFRRKTNEE